MAFDPNREDYLRLGLRFARSLDGQSSAIAAQAFASFGRRFAQNRDELPQTDEDRAFHLVALAATSIDYDLPFADDSQAVEIIEQGHTLLNEALELDPHCYDAIRMQKAAAFQNFEAYYDFLRAGAADVKAYCEEKSRQATAELEGECAALEHDIAMRPYLRWLATYANKALICGRNRETIRIAQKVLELDPLDGADVRFTAALAFAKLEDGAGLDSLHHAGWNTPALRADNAWMQLARIALTYKEHHLQAAQVELHKLLALYPHTENDLVEQRELPDGVFARLAVAPRSEDELILALSEATVLLQEGSDLRGRGSLGAWIEQEARHLGGRSLAELQA